MFHASRRGPASITATFRALSSTARIPSTRPSTLTLSCASQSRVPLEARWFHISSQWQNQAAALRTSQREENHTPSRHITKFEELVDHGMVHPNVINEITKGMGHHTMTDVQTMTINQGLQGTDIVAQARTGTGKTLGFLLPTIQNILRANPELAHRQRYSRARPSDIRAIIISPTRELAEQIAVEADKLCYATDLRVQVAVGGSNKRMMLNKMQREGCHLLVATPGRLNDLLTDPYSRVRADKTTTLVLDEADRLLDDGFSTEIEAIIDLLPNRDHVDRQTLLFSATMPREVMHLVRRTLKPNFHFCQTIKEGDLQTHEKVPQKVVEVLAMENLNPTLLELFKREIEKSAREAAAGQPSKPFKAIVYLRATVQVELAYEVFKNLKAEGSGFFGKHILDPAEISCMHGQLTQEQRTRVSQRFRNAESAIMFSTDVTARGMDFPNVTHVIQVDLPPNREQYVHRIGRTGRGDKTGEGYILISKFEMQDARRMLRGLPIVPEKGLEAASIDMTRDAQLPKSLAETLSQVASATKMVPRHLKDRSYMALLGIMKGQRGTTSSAGIEALNQLTRYGWGYAQPPAIPQRVADKMGLRRFPGMNISDSARSNDQDDESRRGFASDSDRGGFGGDRGGGRSSYGGLRGGSSGFAGGLGSFGGDKGSGRSFDRNSRGGSSRGGGGYGDRGSRGSNYGGRGSRNDRRGQEEDSF